MEKNLSEWKEAIDLLCYAPGFDTYMEAIGKDVVPDRAVEKETRILAWRSYNDRFRKNIIKGYRKWDSKAVKNAETLIEMLDENDPGEGLQRAELFRELGYFDEALIQLDSLNLSNEDNYANMATQIYALAEQKNPNVTKLEV